MSPEKQSLQPAFSSSPLERSVRALSPQIRTVGVEACPSPTESLPATLCQAIGAESTDCTETHAPAIESFQTTLCLLEGYVRLRMALRDEQYTTAERRDAAILASDHLHASAYAAIDAVTLEPRRHLECYRVLTATSRRITETFATTTHTATTAPSRNPISHPVVHLGSLACALCAITSSHSSETTEALETYGRSLVAAVELADSQCPLVRTTVLETLRDSHTQKREPQNEGKNRGDDRPTIEHALESLPSTVREPVVAHLETASESLARLTGDGEDAVGDQAMRQRLETAITVEMGASNEAND